MYPCNGSCTPLTASGASTYIWSPSNSLSSTTGSTVTSCPTSTTTYTTTGTYNGCTSTTSVVVTVNPNPIPTITGTTLVCNGSSTTLTASGGGTYSWNTGANTAAITVSPTTTTNYTVIVTTNGCTGTATVTVTVCTGIEEIIDLNNLVKVYPNPFSDNTTFTIQSTKLNETYSFELIDVLGKQVKSLKEISAKQFEISRNGLPNGIYFYKIHSAESVVGIGKLIVK